MNTTANNYNSSLNHNLSSILSQIQDNGPAYEESIKQRDPRDSLLQQNTRRDGVDTRQKSNELCDDDTLSISSDGMQEQSQHRTKNSVLTKKDISPGVWLQLLLLLISAALLASTLFRLDAQTNDIENSLSVYDENIDEKVQESVDLQKKHLSYGATKINAALQSLQKELKLIKTDYSALNKKYVAIAQSKATAETQNAAAPDDVSAFKHEILSLKTELQTVKEKLKLSSAGQLSAENTVHKGVIVNLASLSNRVKADKIVQQLQAEGLIPKIEQAFVNGERVYRLSVSGFVNRDEAESFIRKAGENFGMYDSLIRKS